MKLDESHIGGCEEFVVLFLIFLRLRLKVAGRVTRCDCNLNGCAAFIIIWIYLCRFIYE
jgi:hypothetical protein